jgi:hypothetical protein
MVITVLSNNHQQAAFKPQKLKAISLLIATGLCACQTSFAEEALVTDRPDFTESTQTVAPGLVQIEAGLTYTDTGLDQFELPEALFRIGLIENLELRIEVPNYTTVDTPGDNVDGFSDGSIGVKVHLADQNGALPDLGLIASASLPVGKEAFSSDNVDPTLTLAWAYDLDSGYSIGGNVGVTSSDGGGDDRFLETAYSFAAGIPLTESWSAYVEYYGLSFLSSDEDSEHYMNGGFTYLVNNNLQLDWRIGFGLTDNSDDLFTGAGLSVRF